MSRISQKNDSIAIAKTSDNPGSKTSVNKTKPSKTMKERKPHNAANNKADLKPSAADTVRTEKMHPQRGTSNSVKEGKSEAKERKPATPPTNANRKPKQSSAPVQPQKNRSITPKKVVENRKSTPDTNVSRTTRDGHISKGEKAFVLYQSDYQVADLSQARAACTIDAAILSTDPKSYISHNVNIYYIAINTWLLQFSGSPHLIRPQLLLRDIIVSRGLLYCINECNMVSEMLISSFGQVRPDWNKSQLAQIVLGASAHAGADDKQLLQLLRFLKRFSPSAADRLLDASLDAFYKVNARCLVRNRDLLFSDVPKFEYSLRHSTYQCEYLEKRIRDITDVVFKKFDYYFKRADEAFSGGSSQDGKTLREKINSYARYTPYWSDIVYPLGNKTDEVSLDTTSKKAVVRWEFTPEWESPLRANVRRAATCIKSVRYDYTYAEHYTLQPSAVAKSYKSARIIASENAYHGAKKQRVREAIYKCIAASPYHSMFDPTSQADNEDKCIVGSATGAYATIDLSGASDSIGKSFASRVLPVSLLRELYPHQGRYLRRGKDEVRCGIHATSGSPDTFGTLGIICLAVCIVGTDMTSVFYGQKLLTPVIFGDDCVVDTRAYECICGVFERLGFVINTDKSYTSDSSYRESCGAEGVLGYDISTSYWPRKEFNFYNKRAEMVTSLVSLQHKLFYLSWEAQRFLAGMIRQLSGKRVTDIYPETEVLGDSCSIWSEYPDEFLIREPYATVHHDGNSSKFKNCMVTVSRDAYDAYIHTFGGRVIECGTNLPNGMVQFSPACRRETKVTTVYKDVPYDSALEMYYYVQWLKKGPQYEDGLMRLLGIPMVLDKRAGASKGDLTIR